MDRLKREHLFHVKMNDQERTALDRLASVDGRNPSEAMREALRKVAQERGVWPASVVPQQGETRDAAAN